MELTGFNSKEAACFIEKLDEMVSLIKMSIGEGCLTLDGETYLTNFHMGEIFHISKRALQEYRDTGKIPYIKFGGRILYKKSDILKILRENYHNPYQG